MKAAAEAAALALPYQPMRRLTMPSHASHDLAAHGHAMPAWPSLARPCRAASAVKGLAMPSLLPAQPGQAAQSY